MAGNYIALYVHLIWTTKYCEAVLSKNMRYRLFEHIRNESVKRDIDVRIINGVDDHVHCLIALKTTQSISVVVKFLKGESSHWINEGNLIDGPFA